nr:energy transducer TonB [Solimonas sp. SE-A11]
MRILLLALLMMQVACAGGAVERPQTLPVEDRAASMLQKEQAAWAQAIARKLRAAWMVNGPVTENFRCVVRVELADDGRVTDASLVQPCGSEELDRSVIAAAHRASPMPLPDYAPAFDPVLVLRLCLRPGPPC